MTCRRFDELLCDYFDAVLKLEDRRRLEEHAASCPRCGEQLAETQWAFGLLQQAPKVDPPSELISEILRSTSGAQGALAAAGGGGRLGWLQPFFQPWMEPRFAMTMAMIVLSFSMLAFSSQQAYRAWQTERSGPIAFVKDVREDLDLAWSRGTEIYETLRMSYQAGSERRTGGSSAASGGQSPGSSETQPSPENEPGAPADSGPR